MDDYSLEPLKTKITKKRVTKKKETTEAIEKIIDNNFSKMETCYMLVRSEKSLKSIASDLCESINWVKTVIIIFSKCPDTILSLLKENKIERHIALQFCLYNKDEINDSYPSLLYAINNKELR